MKVEEVFEITMMALSILIFSFGIYLVVTNIGTAIDLSKEDSIIKDVPCYDKYEHEIQDLVCEKVIRPEDELLFIIGIGFFMICLGLVLIIKSIRVGWI